MKKELTVYVEGIGDVSIEEKSKLEDISKLVFGENYKDYLGARVSNQIFHLNKRVEEAMKIRFIDSSDIDGHRIYTKTISAVFIMACKKLFPNRTVKIEHFLGAGLYTEFEEGHTICFKDVEKIQNKMVEIISKDYPIIREEVSREKAIKIFEEKGYHSKFCECFIFLRQSTISKDNSQFFCFFSSRISCKKLISEICMIFSSLILTYSLIF